MARILRPLVRDGGYYPSNRWTPLAYPGGYTTQNGNGEQPTPPTPTQSNLVGSAIVGTAQAG